MKILSLLISPIFMVVFFLLLFVFHPLQWLGLNVFGYKGHKFTVEVMNFLLVKSLLLLGVPVTVKNNQELPLDTTLVFVSNHQSVFDIPPIIWAFRKYQPKFVSKAELGKGIPSISYNLRHGGAALIDRKDPKQAITALVEFSKRIHKNNWSAVIFPEGTRSRNGKPKSFASSGLKIITKYNKEGYVVPLTINNSWKVFKYGKFPLGMGSPITITTHAPIKISSLPFEELLEQTEAIIKKHVN
ncbi:1-acyl-sn-glycerol-3-phosphate acyltransferase [Polaribacter sp.]|jgi:1-acyl-sn-glycerol-3-phosphate acyltransferase|nr:1-acyl-sn-glycerol-3-phosphate acyltransferase [Polaribacter sp.]|tara:strand:- start:2144 stop:2872 length:729 start_codon:yes stop_codon:yes gene_type:complete